MFNEKQILGEQLYTDETGCLNCNLNLPKEEAVFINNVAISLQLKRYDRAKISISLTDEGNEYPYELPSFEIIPEVWESGYKNVYPYGKVTSMQIKVEVPEGTEAIVEQIAVNVKRPFQIKMIRILVLYGILLGIWGIGKREEWTLYPCKRASTGQKMVIISLVMAISVLGLLLSRSNPACTRNLWPHHGQYQELAQVLAKGEVALQDMPEEELLQVENPYDTVALREKGIPYKMDYAFYNGRYYAYFGIVPELLFYLPYFLLFGKDFPNFLAVAIFFSGFVAGIFGLVWELVHKQVQKFLQQTR